MTRVWVVTAKDRANRPDEVLGVFQDRQDAEDCTKDYPGAVCSVTRCKAWAMGERIVKANQTRVQTQ